ncbi:MAG: hypothetical protein R6U78_10275 [Bacteroidales bacterium]
MKKTIVRILISIAIFIGLDLLAGIFLIPGDFASFRTRHYYYHHGLLPNQDAQAAWGSLIYPVHTNSMGMVDSSAYRLKKRTENHRIMVLGDSHSEGVGVPYPKTFSGRLARNLKPHGIEVINASAVSYSQKIEFLKAEYLIGKKGLEVDEILVLIDISDIQNELVYEHYRPREKSAPGDLLYRTGNRLRKISSIYYLTDAIRKEKQQDRFFGNIESFYQDARDAPNANIWELYSGFFSHFDDQILLSDPRFHGMGSWMEDSTFRELALRGIAMGQEYMLKLKDLCDRHGIRLTLSVHPWHYQIRKGELTDEYVKRWESFSVSNGISFINLYPLFIDTEEDPETVIKKYFISNDNHWNEFGHRRVAARLESFFLNADYSSATTVISMDSTSRFTVSPQFP